MRKTWYIFLFCLANAYAQRGLFINGPDAALQVTSGSTVCVKGNFSNLNCDPVSKVRISGVLYCSGNLVNDDSLVWLPIQSAANEALLVIDDLNTDTFFISGSVRTVFRTVTINRALSPVLLQQDMVLQDTLRFKSGHLFLNQNTLYLQEPQGQPLVMHHPWIKDERQSSGIRTLHLSDTGKVHYSGYAVINNGIGLGNIGLAVKGPVNVGDHVTVVRRHQLQYLAGKSSIALCFDISGQALTNQDTLVVNYSAHQLSSLPTGLITSSLLGVYVSSGQDLWWYALPIISGSQRVGTSQTTGTLVSPLHAMTTPLAQISPTLFRVTIADPSCGNFPPGFVSADTLHLCQGTSYTLQAGNTSPVPNTPLRYEWRTPLVAYTATCVVTPTVSFQKIKLTSVDVRGCITLDSCIVAPTAPLPQVLYFNHLNACFGDSVLCKDSVIISSGTYTNTFLTSDNQSGLSPTNVFKIKFPSAGIYTIQLKATSNYGCESVAIRTNVQVYSPPIAIANVSLNCSNHHLQFSSVSLPGHANLQVAFHQWTILNTTYQSSAVAIAAPVAGQYTYALRIEDNAGCKDSLTSLFLVPSQNTLSMNVYNRCEGDTTLLQFNGTCAYAPCQVKWRPGDGTLDSGTVVSRVYPTAGQKIVSLYVTGQQGCVDSLQQVVTLNSQPSASISGGTTICSGVPLAFIGMGVVAQGSVITYLWNGQQASPVVSFTALPGYYTQHLEVITDSGCVHSSTHSYTVWPRPVAAFYANPVCKKDSVYFLHNGSNGQQIYQWHYGNGTTSGWLLSPQHHYLYSASGNYTVQETVQNNFGCSDSVTAVVQVQALPQVNLGGTLTTCGTQYSLQTINANSTYTWWPMGVNTSTAMVFQTGWVGVRVKGANGCAARDSVYIHLNAVYRPQLGDDRTACGPLLLQPNAPAQTYSWSTGASTPTLQVINSGLYVLTALDQNGCSGADTIQVNILPPASIHLPEDTSLCFQSGGLFIAAVANTSLVTWQDGVIGATRNILRSGHYIATALLGNGCKAVDTLRVQFKTTPVLTLSNSYTSCTTVLIYTGINDALFDWSDGTHQSWLMVDRSAQYTVTATTPSTGCSAHHSFSVGIYPPAPIDLGRDTVLCSNSGYWLSTGNFMDTIRWMDGVTFPDRYVTLPGVYTATATNVYGCQVTDAVVIQMRRAPDLAIGPELQYLCGTNALTAHANAVCDWYFNDHYLVQTDLLSIDQPGIYVASYSANGCTSTRLLQVIQTNDSLTADFLVATRDTIHQPVQFVCLTNPLPLAVEWDFGDGQHSTELHPVHAYSLPRDYSVTLTVWNEECEATQSKSLRALFRKAKRDQVAKQLEVIAVNLYPVPATKVCYIDLEISQQADIHVQLFDATGRLLLTSQSFANNHYRERMDLSSLQQGWYACVLRVQNTNGCILLNKKLIIE